MNDLTMFYPDFIANQVLTNTQLNNLRDYLDSQDRQGRIRLAGTGIICGLNFFYDSTGKTITIYGGYGLSSDGYLLEFEEQTLGYVTEYEDPDSVDGVPNYDKWRTGNPPTKLTDLYLLTDDNTHDALDSLNLADFVLVLYLEREEVDLNSCLVTECDNKGINVNLNLKPLLVKKSDLDQIPTCVAPEPVRISRLKTVLDLATVGTISEINQAYEILIQNALPELQTKLTDLKNLRLLIEIGVATYIEGLVNFFVTRMNNAISAHKINQYFYDYIKDLADAYNEASAAYCELVPDCFATGDFSRHLMLGVVLPGATGYRQEFVPAPFKNVFVHDEKRVLKLFVRIFIMLEKFGFPYTPELRITPSQTEMYPLGERAVPYYYGAFSEFIKNWQPQGCCTLKPVWSYHKPDLPGGPQYDLDFDYKRCSLLRIEGYLGESADTALSQLATLRNNHNAEFGIAQVFLDDLSGHVKEIHTVILEMHNNVLSMYNDVQKLIYRIQTGEMSYKDGLEQIEQILQDIDSKEEDIGVQVEAWQQFYAARKPLCDYSDIEGDYAQLRIDLLSRLYEFRGLLLEFDPSKSNVKSMDDAELLESLQAYLVLLGSVLLHKVRWFIANCLHEDIKKVNFSLLLSYWRELYASMIMFWVLYKRALEVLREKTDQYQIAYAEFKLPDDFMERYRWFGPRLRQLATDFTQLRSKYLNTLGKVAALKPGIEHVAGVVPGGHFIAVCDGPPGNETTVADFSLLQKLDCCCEPSGTNPINLHAQADFVTIKWREPKASHWVVNSNIHVLGNDFESTGQENQKLYIEVRNTETELGGFADEDSANPGVINYHHPNPAPFASDKFYYELRHSDISKKREIGVVIVHFWPEEKATASLKGKVITEGKIGIEPVVEAKVLLNEIGQSVLTEEDGGFHFEELPTGIHTLYVSKEGYRTEIRTVELEESEEDSIEIELHQLLPGTILGRTLLVYNFAGGQVFESFPGISITIQNSDIDPVITGANGEFRFDNVMPRKYILETFFETPAFSLVKKFKTIVLGETEMQQVYFNFTIEDFIENPVVGGNWIALDETNHAVAVANYVSNNYQLLQLKDHVSGDAQSVYERIRVFTNDEIINSQLSNTDKQKRYDQVVQNIEKSMRSASAEAKVTYKSMLELASKAYLDVMTVSSSGMTDEIKIAVNSVTANIKSAGIDVKSFSTNWSKSLRFTGAAGNLAKEISGLIK